MRFLVCPKNCSAGMDDSPAGTPRQNRKGKEEKHLIRQVDLGNTDKSETVKLPGKSRRTLGFKNVLNMFGSHFSLAKASAKESRSRFYRVADETSPPLIRRSTVRDLSKGGRNPEANKLTGSDLISYSRSPRRFSKNIRTPYKTERPGMIPPEKPKRSFAGKNDVPRRSPSLSVRKIGLRSPPAQVRINAVKSRKMKTMKKAPLVYKETSFLSTILEESPPSSGGVTTKKVEVTTEEKKETVKGGETEVKADKSSAEVKDKVALFRSTDLFVRHGEEFVNEKMPKKSGGGKKGFSFMGSKAKEKQNEGSPSTSVTSGVGETAQAQSPIEERYSSFVQVPPESKSKSQMKKQKKKERQTKLEIEKMEKENQKALEVGVVADVEWETTSDIIGCRKSVANVEEDVLKISEVDVINSADKDDCSDLSPSMNEEEEKSLREFLRTLEIVDSRVREQSEMVKKSIAQSRNPDPDYEAIEFSRGIKTVEPIAEEIFEEILEEGTLNEYGRFSSGSPATRNRMKIAEVKTQEPPKILYSYNGVPFTDNDRKPAILVQDIDDGILVINNIRCKEKDRFPFRQLDVILEESSDVSDTSSVHSDKKNDPGFVYKTVLDRRERIFDGRGKTFDLQIQPVIKETVKIFPLHQKATNGLKTDSTQVRIQTVVLEKVHPTSIVKIELPEKESDGDEDKQLTEDDDGVEIVCLDDRSYENIDIAGDCRTFDKPYIFEDPLSARHLLRSSREIKFIDEDSEPSWSSGGFNVEDGVEADVESELDSRRETFLFSGGDNDVSIDLDEILESNCDPDYNTIKKSPLKNKNERDTNDSELVVVELDSLNSKGAPSPQELLSAVQASVKTSPSFSGRDSASSIASGGTVKQVTPVMLNGSDDGTTANDEKIVSTKEEINLGQVSTPILEAEEFGLESQYKDNKILAQMEEVRRKVNVKQLAKSLEKDIDKILKSKMKVIEFFEEPVMSETSWSTILENTRGKPNRRSGGDEDDDVSLSGKSNFSLIKFKHLSNSSSYENVSKSRESMMENENIYEAILTPEALSNLAEKKVMSLPYGQILLKKIGLGKCCEDSKDGEDDIYTKIDAKVQNSSAGSQHLTRSHSTSSSDTKSRCLPCGNSKTLKKPPEPNHPSYIEFKYSGPSSDQTEKWYGMPTSHPALLLGLSPSQKQIYEKRHKRFISNQEEAANLLDLHKKFIERRSYNEGNPFRRDRTVVFDSKEAIYSEIIPKEKRVIDTGRKGVVADGVRDTVEGKRDIEADYAKVGKRSEGLKDIGSCGLLAILQNATSDGSLHELNDKTSCGSSFEAMENTSREESSWQKDKKFGSESKNVLQTGHVIEEEYGRKADRGCKKEEENGAMSGMGSEKRGETTTTEEDCIITTSLSSVSDVIKSFEEPTLSRRSSNGEPRKNIGDVHILLDNEKYRISKKGDIAVLLNGSRESSRKQNTLSEQEIFKQKMYDEYMSKVAERFQRRQQKQIILSQTNERDESDDGKVSGIESEFISKARERMDKFGAAESSEMSDKSSQEFEELFETEFNFKEGTCSKRNSVQLLLDATSDLAKLPKHLKDFLQSEDELWADDNDGMAMISPTFKATAPRPGIWSPVQTVTEEKTEAKDENEERKKLEDEPIPPVWTPRSAQASPIFERKEFRPVTFESPTLPRKKYIQEERSESVPPPWQQPGGERLIELVKTSSSPALSLPKAPNPTVTLLQKAREGHIPRGAHYLNYNMSESLTDDGSLSQRNDNAYSLRDDLDRPKKIELAPKKIIGIGPTTKEGIPLVLRSEVTDENKEKWYKRMYDSLHKAGKDEDYVTVKYRTSPSRKGLYGYQPISSSGYQSEPESIIYDTNRYNKYTTLDRRRAEKPKESDYISVTLPRSRASTPRYGSEPYRNQPGRIEDYEPGHSSISELEARQWWDEVLEIFDRWLEGNPDGHGPDSHKLLTDAIHRRRQEEKGQPIYKAQSPKSFMTYALKDSGYISDPQHVFKRREDDFQSQLSPQEQKEAYRVIQKGGEVPLRGLRKPAPERPKEDRNAQIEYFPLSPTLTRIRVHKQNITPLNQFPFLQFPLSYQQNTVNYPNLPFGVCNSFSHVQIFPPCQPIENRIISGSSQPNTSEKSVGENRKFSVQLQNISESNDYVQIVPQPRSQPKKAPIYANIPVRVVKEERRGGRSSLEVPLPRKRNPESSNTVEKGSPYPKRSATDCKAPVSEGGQVKGERKTFSDLKRIAPSILSKSLSGNKQKNPGGKLERVVSSLSTKKTVTSENTQTPDKSGRRLIKSRRDLSTAKDSKNKSEEAGKKASKPVKKPLSSVGPRKDKPSNDKRLKNENIKNPTVKEESLCQSEDDISDYLGFSIDSQPESTLIESAEEEAMDVTYETVKPKTTYKHKVESNVTEAFRSRSFSPDVRRKVAKPSQPVTPPTPPKRKQSKNSSTLRMWSKMMVTYPYHRSRLDVFDSNVKFLREKLRRKLEHDAEDKENESQLVDDVETVRTVKKEKDGSMSIKTNRYVNIARPVSTSTITPLRYTYNEHGRRVLSEPRASTVKTKSRRGGDVTPDPDVKRCVAKQKSDTLVKSSTTYSVTRPVSQEDKRKSVKVTVAVSSKGKEFLRKSASVPSTVKPTITKSSSPCPSISSYRSGLSGKSLSEKGSTISSPINRVLSPTSSGRASSPSRSVSPASVAAPIRRKVVSPPLTLTFAGGKSKKLPSKKPVTKLPVERNQSEVIKTVACKTDVKRKVKKTEKVDGEKKAKKNGAGKTVVKRKDPEKKSEESKNEVTEHTNLVRTDSFFQNLFLRGPPDKKPMTNIERTCSVLERAQRYQRYTEIPREQRGEPSLSLITYYLTQKRPVSLSRFRYLDRELSSSRSPSPYLSRSPSFHVKLRHFDSLSQLGEDDFASGQLTPNVKGRSSSEPPIIRSQVSSPEERIPIKPASRLSVSETSSLRTSPNSSRSPSCRRIRTLKPSGSISELKKRGPRARSAGDLEDSKGKHASIGSLAYSTSSLNLSNFSDHGEYQAYVLELMHSKEKCQRFRDLHKFYSSLERMGELERATSVGDLRPRLKNEEIIDFDRWKQLRTKERAEAELKSLVGNLLKVQKEKDLVFRTTDVDAVRWKGDRGLRLKERSVEDLKEQFNKSAEGVTDTDNFQKCLESGKDVYKPFWRANSIMNLANSLNATTASYRGRPVTLEELERIKAAEERLARKFGLKSFSTRAWSSLSNDQVNSLKNQLNEIYTQELRKKGYGVDDLENYEITVPRDSNVKAPGEKGLYVRCNSAMTKDQVKKEELREGKKSGSISALPSWKSDGEDRKGLLELPWKEDGDRRRPLSETEKKRLSMTLSKEVLEKLRTPVKTHLLPRETLGALVVASNALRPPGDPPQEVFSPRTCYSLETSEDGKSKNDFLLVLTPTEKGKDMEKVVEEWANGTSDNTKPGRTTSITELESASASSETSVKTVIRNPVDVLKKVEYYEDLQQSAEESMAAEGSIRGLDVEERRSRIADGHRRGLVPSHSLENIQEYFGEQQKYTVSAGTAARREDERIRSENFNSLRRVFEEENRTPIGYRSSNESVFSLRSRSVSPDPTKYYRAYLRMVKCGAVRKLCNKFESWEDLLALSSERDRWLPPKRYASDPELTRDLLRRYGTDPTKVTIRGQEVGDVRWLRTKYEKDDGNPRRRFRSPVPRSPLSATDRFMPRINVISKTAKLQMSRRRSPDGTPSKLPASPEPYRSLSEYTCDHGGYYYTGEVEKLRRKFEKLHATERLSILGQMYTSTPDVNELRDIAPYLGCSWVAHRHPELSKTSSSPDLRFRRSDPPKKFQIKPRPHSSSPVRPKQPSSILKTAPQRDIFADQKFDPSIHRPVYRYQPEVDRPKRGSPVYPQWRQWNKPSVKFKEPVDFFPEPKLRETTPDSPRKYVESEVTIHYKSPVRAEAKAMLSEDELARRQAESMKRIYKEERRRKYLQELQDMNSRRHADNFIPSQKSPIPLNRYDDFPFDETPFHFSRARDHSTEPVLVARGLYDFVGRRPRELAFRRGDVIFIIRQLDKNWCEGELNGTVGLFPLSYVEIIPYSEYNPKFGRARAKYDFVPQTSLELSARKGEMITLVQKIDENWFEGRIGERTGIIPASYCQVLSLPQVRIPSRSERATSTKPVASPAAHSLIHNGGAISSKHYYTPFYGGRNSPGRSNASPAVREAHAAIDQLIDEALLHLEEDIDSRRRSPPKPLNLRVNPRPEPALYQVLFNHVPNNDDELELIQGETVLVLEKCGDGWYIGSKTSGGKLGIFPGTHVRRIGPEFV